MLWIEVLIVIAALALGARIGGIFLGIAGGLGLGVLVFACGLAPTSPPIDVMLIITSVIMAASLLQVAGGMDYLVGIAERLLRSHPKYITFLAPMVCYFFTFMAGTGNIAFALLPVIAEVSRETGVRPERPMSISVVASQQAITASPVSAAMAALVALLAPLGVSMGQIMLVCVPATIIGCLLGALTVWKRGLELDKDPEYQKRLAAGMIPPVVPHEERKPIPGAKLSVLFFVLGAIVIVLLGTIPSLRPTFLVGGKVVELSMTYVIEIVMLVVAGLVALACKPPIGKVAQSSVFQAGMTGVICIYGLAWMGDTLISAYLPDIKLLAQDFVNTYPWTFAIGMGLVGSVVLSQAATTRLLYPLAIALSLSPAALVASWPASACLYIIPTYATIVAGVAFDSTGTTRIGKFVINHSYLIPGLTTTISSVAIAFAIASVVM